MMAESRIQIFSLPTLALCFLVLLLARLGYNYTRLSIPGPFLASITDLWRFYHHNTSHGVRIPLLKLHQRYGPVVRYGVNSVSISSPEGVPLIYGSRAGFVTADSYKVLIGTSNGKAVPSLVSTKDEARHGALRRSIAGAFTPNGVLPMEECIDQTIRHFRVVLAHKKEPFDLPWWMLLFSMDAAAQEAFSESRGYLDAGADVDGTIAVVRSRFGHWGRWAGLPDLERLIYRNPISMRRKQTPSSMAAAAMGKLQSRISGKDSGKQKQDLLQYFLTAHETHPELLDKPGIVGLLMSTISGAGDTTATTLAAIIYFLLAHPSDLATLIAELKAHNIRPIPKYNETANLPFLHAIIRESMRCFSSTTWPIERLVPTGGITIANHSIPEGTSVGVLAPALHLNTSVYGEDAHLWRPRRWLDAEEGQLRQMEASHMGFSRGRRVCLGQNIAIMQMKKMIPMLVLSFKMELVEPNKGLEADFSPAVACLGPLYVKITEILDGKN